MSVFSIFWDRHAIKDSDTLRQIDTLRQGVGYTNNGSCLLEERFKKCRPRLIKMGMKYIV